MNENSEPVFWPWFISLGGCCGVVSYFLVHSDHVTAVCLIALVLSALSGYGMTASRLACWYCGLAVASVLTSILILFCQPVLAAWLGTSGFLLSVIAAGIVVAFATTAALRRLVVRYFPERPSLEAFNRWAGFVIGAGQGTILCMFVLGGLLIIEPIAEERLAHDVQSRDNKITHVLATKVTEYAEQTSQSAIGRTAAHYDLFRLLPSIAELRDGLDDLRNPLTRTPSKSEQTINEHLAAQ